MEAFAVGTLGLGWVASFCYIGFSKLHMSREWLEIEMHWTHRQSLYSINLKSLKDGIFHACLELGPALGSVLS